MDFRLISGFGASATAGRLAVCTGAGLVERSGSDLSARSSRTPWLGGDVAHHAHVPPAAFGAGIAIEGGVIGLGFARRLFVLRVINGLPDRRQALPAATVGEESVVTDAHEALGQHVEQKAAQQLFPAAAGQHRDFDLERQWL